MEISDGSEPGLGHSSIKERSQPVGSSVPNLHSIRQVNCITLLPSITLQAKSDSVCIRRIIQQDTFIMKHRQGQIRHILDLSKEEKREFSKSFDTIMSDCDGVVWHFTGPIPNVDKALQLLKKKGKKLAFISNNGMRTMEEYKQKFLKLGIPSHELDIVHPALTTVRYLKAINMQDAVYCIATEVFKDYLRNEGFTVLDGVSLFKLQTT